MAIDSAASLLFQIKANPDDAQANIKRFRSLLSTDVASMRTQLSQWSEEMFGSSEKVKAAHEQLIQKIQQETEARKKNATTAEETAAIEVEAQKRVAAAQDNLAKKLQSVGLGWQAVAAVAATAAIGLGASLFEMAKKTAETGEQLENLHQETGLSVQMLSALRVRSDEMGLSFDQVGITVETLARNLSPYVRQTSMAARAAHDLGVSAYNADGSLKSMDQMLLDTMDALHKTGVGSRATAAAVSFLSTSGAKMIPIFMGGSKSMKEAMERAKAMGQMFTDVSANQSSQFLESFRDIKYTVEGLGVTIGQKVMPYITSAMQGMANFLVGHAQAIGNTITDLGEVFKGLGYVVRFVAELIMANIAMIEAYAKQTMVPIHAFWDAIHGHFAQAKNDFASLKTIAVDAWTKVKAAFASSGDASTGSFAALGRAMEGLLHPTKAAQQAVDKFADSLANVRQEIQSLQDQQAKPAAAIEAQYQRAKEAADREIRSYQQLAAKGKITRAQLGDYEREYHELVLSLAQERALKLSALEAKRVHSVEQLDADLKSKLETDSKDRLQKRMEAINKEIAAETAKYRALGALDMAHIEMLNELRSKLILQAVADEAKIEQDAQDKREKSFASHLERLQALGESYEQRAVSKKDQMIMQYQREIQQIEQMRQALMAEASTEQQRAQIVQAAASAEQAARDRELTGLKNLEAQQNSLTQQWRQSYNALIQLTDNFSKRYQKAAHQILAAIDQQIIAHQREAKSAGMAATMSAKDVIGAIKQVAIVKAIFETAESIAAFARLDFRAGTQHALAAVQYGIAAAAQISGLFGGGGGGGGHARAAQASAAGGHSKSSARAGGSSSPAPNINVHIDGVISSDNLATVMGQISGLVSSGNATLPASHLVVNGALVPAGAAGY